MALSIAAFVSVVVALDVENTTFVSTRSKRREVRRKTIERERNLITCKIEEKSFFLRLCFALSRRGACGIIT